jgi:uncharacterized membrane protein
MLLLILGLVLWCAGHFFKRVMPKTHAAMGRRAKLLAALSIAGGVVLMIVGYRGAEPLFLYALPIEAWWINNAAMLAALFLVDVGRAHGVVRTKIRHPMLLGVAVWAAAHLLVNGDLPSLVLFGGLGAWAMVEMAVINRAEGAWRPPERGPWVNDAKVAGVAVVIYAVIVGIHDWFDHPALLWL